MSLEDVVETTDAPAGYIDLKDIAWELLGTYNTRQLRRFCDDGHLPGYICIAPRTWAMRADVWEEWKAKKDAEAETRHIVQQQRKTHLSGKPGDTDGELPEFLKRKKKATSRRPKV